MVIRTHHSLCPPASPGQIIARALRDAGKSKKWLRAQLGWSKDAMRSLLGDTATLTFFEAINICLALGRPDLRLMHAQRLCAQWRLKEHRLKKERAR